jgi:membrane-bound serine protease (ClpP class)
MSAIPARAIVRTVLFGILALALLAVPRTGAQSDQPLVHVIDVDGAITSAMARHVERSIERAEEDGATLLVIELDTPGGAGDAMDDIVDDILESQVPVAVYVSPVNARAASAGVFITYAAHIAAMAPATNIGSASPVLTGSTGSIGSDEAMERKVMNDAVARITNLAQLRGRNVDWAVAAVRDADNITADTALSLGVIDLMAPDLGTLLASIDGRQVTTANGTVMLATADARIERFDMNIIDQLVQALANPTIAYLLVTFGMIALFTELANPGIGFAGIGGTIALVLGLVGLGSLQVVWLGLGLMILAFVLFVVDIFVPSLGLLTVGGLVAFLVGSNILIADGTPSELRISRPVIWAVTACIAATAFLLGSLIVKTQLRPTSTGRTGMVGQIGTARTDLSPNGQVLVFGEIWAAEAVGDPIPAGTRVAVEQVSGLRISVRPATEAEVNAAMEGGDPRAVIPVR